MKRFSLFLRALSALLLCGWLGACALPSDFEEDAAWADEPGFAEEGAERPPPRVVFEPPRFVTLPPGLMPVKAEEIAEPMPTEPPVEPVLPDFAAEPLPEVTPLLINNKLPGAAPPAAGAPEFPLLSSHAAAETPPKVVAAAQPPPADKKVESAKAEAVKPAEAKPADVQSAESQPGQAPGLKLKPAPTESKLQEVAQHLTTGMLPMLDDPQPETGGEKRPMPAAPAPSAEELPFGIPAPGRPHLLRSPRASEMQLVDVTGMAPGDKVMCPFTGDLFRVPDPAQSMKAVSPADAVAPPN